MHERTNNPWWDSIVFKTKLPTYVKFKQIFKTKVHIFRYMLNIPAFVVNTIPSGGLSRCILKQVDGLTLHSKKDFEGCVLISVLRMNSILFVCVGFQYQNERSLLSDRVSELHPEFASLNAREKFVF